MRSRLPETTNGDGGWQGRFRVGALDGVLLRYAVAIAGGLDGIAVTHLDRPPVPVCDAYQLDGREVRALDPGIPRDLAHRLRLGETLRRARPILRDADPTAFVAEATGLPVVLESRGPRAVDKRWREV